MWYTKRVANYTKHGFVNITPFYINLGNFFCLKLIFSLPSIICNLHWWFSQYQNLYTKQKQRNKILKVVLYLYSIWQIWQLSRKSISKDASGDFQKIRTFLVIFTHNKNKKSFQFYRSSSVQLKTVFLIEMFTEINLFLGQNVMTRRHSTKRGNTFKMFGKVLIIKRKFRKLYS